MFKKYKFVLICIAFLFVKIPIFAERLDFISIHGYGAIGGAYQDNENILYRNSLNTDDGSKGEFSFDTDTKLGLQLDVVPTDKLSLTIQGTASKNHGSDKLIKIAWANIKYRLSDSFDVRVGRMQLPAFMLSDIRNISHYYDWIRLPDMYSTIPFYGYQGVELSFTQEYDNFAAYIRLHHGSEKDKIKSLDIDNLSKTVTSSIEFEDLYGVEFGVNIEALKLSFAYNRFNFSLSNHIIDNSIFYFIGIPIIEQAFFSNIIERTPSDYINFGARYNFENFYLLGEYMRLSSSGFKSDTTSWYVGAGYHFEKLTPYILYSKTKSSSNYEDIIIPVGSPPPVIGAITAANMAFSNIANSTKADQETTTLGLRYDLSKDISLKLQYDYLKEQDADLNININFNNELKTNLHIFSATVSFVF